MAIYLNQFINLVPYFSAFFKQFFIITMKNRLVPCIPIFRGFFLLKVQKGCVYVIMLKIALVLFKIYVLM